MTSLMCWTVVATILVLFPPGNDAATAVAPRVGRDNTAAPAPAFSSGSSPLAAWAANGGGFDISIGSPGNDPKSARRDAVTRRNSFDFLAHSSSSFHEWIYDLVVALPPVTGINVLGWKIELLDGNCTDLTFDTVSRSDAAPHHVSQHHLTKVDVDIHNVGLNCTAMWHATNPQGDGFSGPTLLDVSNSDVGFTAVQDTCENDDPCLRAKNVSSHFTVSELSLQDAPPGLELIIDVIKPFVVKGA